jgi:hypothetical protein
MALIVVAALLIATAALILNEVVEGGVRLRPRIPRALASPAPQPETSRSEPPAGPVKREDEEPGPGTVSEAAAPPNGSDAAGTVEADDVFDVADLEPIVLPPLPGREGALTLVAPAPPLELVASVADETDVASLPMPDEPVPARATGDGMLIGVPQLRPDPDRFLQTEVVEALRPYRKLVALMRLVAAIVIIGVAGGGLAVLAGKAIGYAFSRFSGS